VWLDGGRGRTSERSGRAFQPPSGLIRVLVCVIAFASPGGPGPLLDLPGGAGSARAAEV
jgi:hypothetical protein